MYSYYYVYVFLLLCMFILGIVFLCVVCIAYVCVL